MASVERRRLGSLAVLCALAAIVCRLETERTWPLAVRAHAGESLAKSAALSVVRGDGSSGSSAWLRALTGAFASLVAEIHYIEAIQLYALRPRVTTAAAWAEQDRAMSLLLDRATDLDPAFGDAYRFAGNALPRETSDRAVTGVPATIRLLQNGVRAGHPDWKIPFQLGFIEMHYAGDFDAAARALALAAKEGAPEHVGLLATRIALEAADPSLAERLARELARPDSAEWSDRVMDLVMERHFRTLERAIATYRARTGTRPASLDALVESGDLKEIPAEPRGGRYVLTDDGGVASTLRPRLDARRERASSGLRLQ